MEVIVICFTVYIQYMSPFRADHLSQAFDATVQNKITRCRLQSGTASFQDGASSILKLFLGMSDNGFHYLIILIVMLPAPLCIDV